MFRDEPIQYPEENPVLGRYLGQKIDVGPTMTAKIMMGNGEVVHWPTYSGLKEDKSFNKSHISLRKEFDRNIRDKFGPDISPYDFPDINLEDTPLYEMYEENSTDLEGVLAGNTKDDEDPDMATVLDREVTTPELNENYVNTSVILPRGNSYSRGKVTGWKRYADGNAIGRTNDNLILDTREYHVEFDDGEVIERTANLIVEYMYAACDDSGNGYLTMD